MPVLQASPTPSESVLRVNATSQPYNFFRPWEKVDPTTRSGLGALLPGNRVLVTAEMVSDSTYIELEKADTGEKTPAMVVGLDYEVNLALLAPSNGTSDFFDGMIPLPLDTSVLVGDEVEVWQLESNGTSASTEATVIKVGIGKYFVDGSYYLNYVLRGSLPYRAGSFTLPVVKGEKLIGLLLSYSSKEQTSVIISAPIIDHFLRDLEDGAYEGFPNLGIGYTPTLDEQFRKYLQLTKEDGGVYVRRVTPGGTAAEAGFEVGDVILKVDGNAIDARGDYEHPDYGRLNFSHLVRGEPNVGEVKEIEVLRNGERMTIDLKLSRKKPDDYLIPPYMFDRGPRYLILGGLIFQELTLPYLKSWGEKWPTRAPLKLVHAHANQTDYEEAGREKMVILSVTVLTPATVGYDRLSNLMVTKVNGYAINSLADLKAALDHPEDDIHRIEFDDFPRVIFVDAKMASAVNSQFPAQLGISPLERLD
ncbi:MAG: PDZ domain-containing protein [Verrucomicrobiota bacterium]